MNLALVSVKKILRFLRPFILFMVLVPLSSFHRSANDKLDEIKYQNFIRSVRNTSTFQFFTVVTVKDLRSNVTKEICVKGNFLSGAAHRELKVGYDSTGETRAEKWLTSRKDRYFEFKKHAALKNISFFSYNAQLVQSIEQQYDFDKVVMQIETTHRFSIRLEDDEMAAFAHILFNKGYLTGENGCWGGELIYIDKTNPYYGHESR